MHTVANHVVVQIIFTLNTLRAYRVVENPLFFGQGAGVRSRGDSDIHMPDIMEETGVSIVFQQIFLTGEKWRCHRIRIYI